MTDFIDFDDISRKIEQSKEMTERGEDPFSNDLSPEKSEQVTNHFYYFLQQLDEDQLNFVFSNMQSGPLRRIALSVLLEKRTENLTMREYEPLPLHSLDSEGAYQIKASLTGIRPPIWRRLVVDSLLDFESLHHVFLTAFNWSGHHLYMFEFGSHYECETLKSFDESTDESYGPPAKDAQNYCLGELLTVGESFRYWYDFGDDWCIKIEVEKIVPREDFPHLPYCVKAKRNAPPEDVGGVGGYEMFLEAITDPHNEMHEEYTDWYDEVFGTEFDPELVDVKELNALYVDNAYTDE